MPSSPCLSRGRVALGFLAALLATNAAAVELPVGDGRISTRASAGDVFACQTSFRGGGAQHTGPWFHGDTWDPMAKPRVQGRVMWAEARFRIELLASALAISGNGLPVGHPTGVFPISPSDPAYAYDTNPNPIRAQDMAFEIPRVPVRAASPSCLPMGMIGVSTTGVAFYNALDAAGRDAAAHEVQDVCDGHPQRSGQYHYHSGSPCQPGLDSDAVVGWALDGYPILGLRDAHGRVLTNADLDACHGRAETVQVDGRTYEYAYRLTREYPYTLGCFTGVATVVGMRGPGDRRGPPPGRPEGGRRPPPPGAPPPPRER